MDLVAFPGKLSRIVAIHSNVFFHMLIHTGMASTAMSGCFMPLSMQGLALAAAAGSRNYSKGRVGRGFLEGEPVWRSQSFWDRGFAHCPVNEIWSHYKNFLFWLFLPEASFEN